MKAFEEFKKNFKPYKGTITEDNRDGCMNTPTDEDIWRAALKWVKSQPDGSCGVRKCVPMEAIRDELREEQRTGGQTKWVKIHPNILEVILAESKDDNDLRKRLQNLSESLQRGPSGNKMLGFNGKNEISGDK